jgi:hypothetical protein
MEQLHKNACVVLLATVASALGLASSVQAQVNPLSPKGRPAQAAQAPQLARAAVAQDDDDTDDVDDASAAAAALQRFYARQAGNYSNVAPYANRVNPSHLNWNASQTGVDQLTAWRQMMLLQAQRAQANGATWQQQAWAQQAQQMYGGSGAGTNELREAIYRAALARQFQNGGAWNATTGTGWTGGVYAYPSGFYDPSVNSNYYYLQGQNGATTERYDNGGYSLQTRHGGSVISDGEGGVYVGR